MSKPNTPITTIWRISNGRDVRIAVLPGLPYGRPQVGTSFQIAVYGDATCIGWQTAGSGQDEQVVEVMLRVA